MLKVPDHNMKHDYIDKSEKVTLLSIDDDLTYEQRYIKELWRSITNSYTRLQGKMSLSYPKSHGMCTTYC